MRYAGLVQFSLVFLVSVTSSAIPSKSVLEGLGLDYANYNLTDDQPLDGSYEARRYSIVSYAHTTVTSLTAAEAKFEGIKRLYKYFLGANQEGIKMNMTIPVTTRLRSNPCVFCEVKYNVYFYIPTLYQKNIPVPTDPDVVLLKHLDYKVYVRQFGGLAHEDRARSEASQLYDDVKRNNITGILLGYMWLNEYGLSGQNSNYNEVMIAPWPQEHQNQNQN